jgi:hypothetical protein
MTRAMNDFVYKSAVSTIATGITALQGQTILDTDTLLPAGLWVAGLVVVWRASWRICESVMNLLSRIERVENEIDKIHETCAKMHERSCP